MTVLLEVEAILNSEPLGYVCVPCSLWPVGQVIKTYPSPDGHIRTADVEIKVHVYTRPVVHLVILPTRAAQFGENVIL